MTDVIYWHGQKEPFRVVFGPKDIAANLPSYKDELTEDYDDNYNLAYSILRTYFEVSCGYPVHFCRHAAFKYMADFKREVVMKFKFKETWVINSLYIAKWVCRQWKENLI